jgi:short chain dehydrogenase
MKRAGWGRVIQISSGESLRPFAHMPDYAATKAALHNTTRSCVRHWPAAASTQSQRASSGLRKSRSGLRGGKGAELG